MATTTPHHHHPTPDFPGVTGDGRTNGPTVPTPVDTDRITGTMVGGGRATPTNPYHKELYTMSTTTTAPVLTDRENDVVNLVKAGKSRSEIATALDLSASRVGGLLASARAKDPSIPGATRSAGNATTKAPETVDPGDTVDPYEVADTIVPFGRMYLHEIQRLEDASPTDPSDEVARLKERIAEIESTHKAALDAHKAEMARFLDATKKSDFSFDKHQAAMAKARDEAYKNAGWVKDDKGVWSAPAAPATA